MKHGFSWNILVSVIIPLVLTAPPARGQERRSVAEAKGLPVGAKAPNFKAMDKDGKLFELGLALQEAPVVLVFYRGQWCPYCNRHLRSLQDSLSLIRAKGAVVVAISPEKPQFLARTAAKTGAEFTLLFDQDFKISDAYDVTFTPEDAQLSLYNGQLGADLTHSQSDDSQRLPIPATFIIDKSGTIVWRQFDPDYRKRSFVAEILKHIP